MRPLETAFNSVFSLFALEIVAFCSVAAFLLINVTSMIVLFIFDFLFVSFAFQLAKTIPVKMGLLALGNIVGIFCNSFFDSLSIVGIAYLGEGFRIFYEIAFPLLNTSWMVIFWSLSLASLPKPTGEVGG